jgi:hypothetical protein
MTTSPSRAWIEICIPKQELGNEAGRLWQALHRLEGAATIQFVVSR